MREHERDYSHNAILDLYKANRATQQEFSDLWNRLPSAPILKHTTQVPLNPVQGMFIVDPVEEAWCFYLGTEWICIDGLKTYAIKVYTDRQANKVGNGAFKFGVDPSMAGRDVMGVAIFNGTPAGGATTVQISNQTRTPPVDILSSPLTIGSGGFMVASFSVNTGGPTTLPNNRLELFDDIWVDVDAVASGSKGLGVYIITGTPQT